MPFEEGDAPTRKHQHDRLGLYCPFKDYLLVKINFILSYYAKIWACHEANREKMAAPWRPRALSWNFRRLGRLPILVMGVMSDSAPKRGESGADSQHDSQHIENPACERPK